MFTEAQIGRAMLFLCRLEGNEPGLPVKPKKVRRPKPPEELRVPEMLELAAQGLKHWEIAERMGVSRSLVTQRLRRARG